MERKADAEPLKGIPPRRWVALWYDRSRVVATGGSYGEVVDCAEEAGEHNPVLVMPPPSDGIPVYFA